MAWQHIGVEASSSFADEILFFKYGDSKTSSLDVLINNSMILPDLTSINYSKRLLSERHETSF